MMGYEDLVTWAPAWCIHNRQLQVLFMTQPFFMDPKSITYHQQFKQARVDTITTMSPSSACAVQEWCTSSLRCYLPYDCDCSRNHIQMSPFSPFMKLVPPFVTTAETLVTMPTCASLSPAKQTDQLESHGKES